MYIYLHVPFCLSRCIYCDFYVVLERFGGQDAYVEAVCREIRQRFQGLDLRRWPKGIQTLYIGGGTPSLLPASAYATIFQTLNQYLPLAPDAEMTLEANPGANRSEMADDPAAYRALGFNRISVGVQSFQDAELKKLSRIHSAADAEAFIRLLQATGWENISLDLMYGLPLQTMESWQATLDKTIALNIQHVSMYGLKIEEGTPLETLSSLPGGRGGYTVPTDDVNVAMYFEGLHRLESAGFRRYEFSNLARPGFESRHNLNYWNNQEFMAFGVSAHGYWDGIRYESVRDLAAYLENPMAGTTHPCTEAERLENALIFGLRKAEGVNIADVESDFGISFGQRYGHILEKYRGDFLEIQGDYLRFLESAIPVSNAILAEFLEA
jgi:oxygen-independent coproporphyrinogen-3 oxidase